jgi:hypothetical protein
VFDDLAVLDAARAALWRSRADALRHARRP